MEPGDVVIFEYPVGPHGVFSLYSVEKKDEILFPAESTIVHVKIDGDGIFLKLINLCLEYVIRGEMVDDRGFKKKFILRDLKIFNLCGEA